MIKTITATAVLVVASTSAMAGDVTGELRWGDKINQYKVEVSETVKTPIAEIPTAKISGEIETEQAYKNGAVKSLFNLGVGVPFVRNGYTITPYAQLGDKIVTGKTDNVFYGVGAKVSHVISGPVSAELAYRYRGDFSGAEIAERRLAASVKYAVDAKQTVSVTAYNYSGSSFDHRFGVGYNYKF